MGQAGPQRLGVGAQRVNYRPDVDPQGLCPLEMYPDSPEDLQETLCVLDLLEEGWVMLEASVRQRQETAPRNGGNRPFVASSMERNDKIDGSLTRADQEHGIILSQGAKDPRRPWIAHIPPAG
jgi:hypothetical protein